jgi:beta-aspartyl-dipeptidase (metallo-type)
LYNKGHIQPGKDADLVLLDKETLTIKTVFAQGKMMLKDGVPLVKGTFE